MLEDDDRLRAVLGESPEPDPVSIDLLQYVDDSHILKRMAIEVARAYWLPPSTVFMVGLGIVSSFLMREYALHFLDNTPFGAGLYICAEQKSGGGKTGCISIFLKPFNKIIEETNKRINAEIKSKEIELKRKEGQARDALQSDIDVLYEKLEYRLYFTNTTPEGIEVNLPSTKGFFSCISAEKGLLNVLLGRTNGSSGKKNDNDIILRGFDGDYTSGARVTRKGFTGFVCGSVVTFAQPGSFSTIFEESDGSGLCERFYVLSEPSKVGQINHHGYGNVNGAIVDEYARHCGSLMRKIIENPKEFNELTDRYVSPDDWFLIEEFLNSIEHHRKEGGKYSGDVASSMFAKITKQIVKIANVLYSFGGGDKYRSNNIPTEFIRVSIRICAELYDYGVMMMGSDGLDGKNAEYQAILNIFERSHNRKRTIADLKNMCRGIKPFVSIKAGRMVYAGKVIDEMIKDGKLRFESGYVFK